MLNFLTDMFKPVSAFIRAGTPANEDERIVCENWLRKRDQYLAQTMLFLGIVFHSTSLVIYPSMVRDEIRPLIYGTHVFFLALDLLWVFFLTKQKKVSLQSYIHFLEVLTVLAFAVICHLAYFNPETSFAAKVFASNAFLTITLILALMIPSHNKIALTLTSLFYLGVCVLFMYDGAEIPLFWLYLCSSLMITAFVFQSVHISRTKASAIKEFRTRAGMAPLQVVRKSILDDTTIESVFAPKLRYCVCISSDWRSFQELTTRIDAKAISESLSEYYAICNDELRTFFPEGNYYSDWIADELFIVIFTESPLEIMDLSQRALDFAQMILEKKAVFSTDRNFPFSIDIGMSVGQAMVGMMGPPQHRKATALGKIPGLSRRLQGAGKLLRYNLGEKDRIVFGEELAETLPDNDIVRSFTLEENRKLRDLDYRTLYFVEMNKDMLDLLLNQAS